MQQTCIFYLCLKFNRKYDIQDLFRVICLGKMGRNTFKNLVIVSTYVWFTTELQIYLIQLQIYLRVNVIFNNFGK